MQRVKMALHHTLGASQPLLAGRKSIYGLVITLVPQKRLMHGVTAPIQAARCNNREGRRMPPDLLANQIFHAVQTGQRVLIPGVGNRFFAWLGWSLPRLTSLLMRKVISGPLATKGSDEGRIRTGVTNV